MDRREGHGLARKRRDHRGLTVRTAAAFLVLAACGLAAGAGEIAPAERVSGFGQMQPEIQAMQREDLSNPGMLAVRAGEALWNGVPPGGAACAACHGEASSSMRGVAARYPAFDAASGRPIDLTGRINRCRTERQGQAPLASDATDMLALTAFVGMQSRGLPVASPADARLEAARALGRELYHRRMGQLDLSCSQCHDDHWGRRLGSSLIPQGHANGYPLYRLEWQSLGSFYRRLRNCMTGVRAEPFPAGSDEAIALELHLATRGGGLLVETPAVRP